MHKLVAITVFFLAGTFLADCKKQTDDKAYETYHPYVPLSVGKYITYKLDSTITTSFGTGFDVHTYTVKDSIEAQITDNANRLSYRVVRYQLSGMQWTPVNVFMVTPTANTLEWVDNNIRIIKMVNPVVNGKIWKGNSYVSYTPYFDNSDFKNWTYTYTNLYMPFTVNNQSLDSTITVVSYDSLSNDSFYYKRYSTYTKGYEVYARNVGKVYQDILNWEYQAFTTLTNCKQVRCADNKCDTTAINCNTDNCDSIRMIPGNNVIGCDTILTNYYYNGYGVKLTMIDHN